MCSRLQIIAACLVTLLPYLSPVSADEMPTTADIVVYGGTSAGVMAAVRVAREERSVILVVPDSHIGGTTTGGLGQTDIGGGMSGMAREFYRRVYNHYETEEAWTYETRNDYFNASWYDLWSLEGRPWSREWRDGAALTFEPSVASAVMAEMLEEAEVTVVKGERLNREDGVRREAGWITEIEMESGLVFTGEVFIDATYEGDLMAAAGVTYFVGRESNSVYGETFNGVQTQRVSPGHQLPSGIDPYIEPGDPDSGLLPGVDPSGPGEENSGDHRVQAYNIRITMTDVPENRVPFDQPDEYDELEYELLFRAFEAGLDSVPLHAARMPNRKTDTNNSGGFSTDFIGRNYDYPDADYARREELVNEHRTYIRGLLWTLANHSRVPESIREELSGWGYARDEFAADEHLSPQLYVREARRMVSDYVMTEQDVRGNREAPDGVVIGGYQIDSHHTQRYINAEGEVRNEGELQTGASPYGISYRAIVPRDGEARNLIVPVCVSASHVAYGTIRMEPVYMQLGHVAGQAAVLSMEQGVAVQDVDYFALREKLAEQDLALPETTLTPPGNDSPPEHYYTGFINGDFEDEPFDRYWSVSDNVLEHPGFAPDSTRAAFIGVNPSSDNPVELVQNRPYWLDYIIPPINNPDTGEPTAKEYIPTEPEWRLEFHVVVADPGSPAQRSLNLLIPHQRSDPDYTGTTPPQINFRITGDGGAQAFSGGPNDPDSEWRQVLPAGTFEFSELDEENTFFAPTVYHIKIEGNYSGSDPFYTVTAREDGVEEEITSEAMRAWQYNNPLPGDGIISLRAHGFVDAPYALDRIRLVSVTDLPDGFVSWQRQFFSDSERADESISGPDGDPRGDGTPNLLKYALGLPPRVNGTARLPGPKVRDFEGKGYLTLTFTRPEVVRDIVYQVEASEDLKNWSDSGIVAEIDNNKDGTLTHTYRDGQPVASPERRFLRLRVKGQPP